jgi:hypothetical protein
MTPLQSILQALDNFKPGTRARALFYLKTGALNGDAGLTMQARLDRWVGRIEQFGPGAREKVLRAFEGRNKSPTGELTQGQPERAAP